MSCVTREIVLPVPRERAWELVTEEDELREWLADDVEFEAEEGAPLRVDDREGVVERVEAERADRVQLGGLARRVASSRTTTGGTRFMVTEERHDTVWGPKLTALASAAALCPA